ncbi:MAG TPA: hypothetical protein VGD67_05765 [Pseudonocardiaceae bacterium]
MSAELADRFLAVWGEPDAEVARRRLEEVCVPDLDYRNPVVRLGGTAALAGHIAELAPMMGESRPVRTTGAQFVAGWCRYGWAVRPPLPGVDLHGETMFLLGEDGRITHVVSFHGALEGRTYAL